MSMEVSNDSIVSWFISYLRDLQPAYKGVISQLLSTMDIPVVVGSDDPFLGILRIFFRGLKVHGIQTSGRMGLKCSLIYHVFVKKSYPKDPNIS